MDVRSPMKVETQSDRSTTNSLTDRLGAGPERNTLIHYTFGVQERVQERVLSIEKVPTAKMCAYVGTKPVSASILQ